MLAIAYALGGCISHAAPESSSWVRAGLQQVSSSLPTFADLADSIVTSPGVYDEQTFAGARDRPYRVTEVRGWAADDGMRIIHVAFSDYTSAQMAKQDVGVVILVDGEGRRLYRTTFGAWWEPHSLWHNRQTHEYRMIWVTTGLIFQGTSPRSIGIDEVNFAKGRIICTGHIAIREHVLDHLDGIEVRMPAESVGFTILFKDVYQSNHDENWQYLPEVELDAAPGAWDVYIAVGNEGQRHRIHPSERSGCAISPCD